MNNVYDLADMLADEIEESGKTHWSAKDVKEFFLSEGIDLSLDEILQVWDACSSPVCACELLGCDQVVEADTDVISDNEIVDVYVCDGSDAGSAPDTFYMEAQTQYDVITIYAKNIWLDRYEPKYVLESEEQGILSEGSRRSVVSEFFNLYDVSHDYRREITQFAANY